MEKNGTVMDYLRWRGDLPFTRDGFNEVDDLVLCIISYINFRRFDNLKTTDPARAVALPEVAARLTEEDEQLEIFVKLSGLTKQDYITRRLLEKEIVVQGNPRVYKALRDQLAAVLGELRRMEAGGGVDDELLATIRLITVTLGGMKED